MRAVDTIARAASLLCLGLAGAAALAQQDLEPAVQTSSAAAASASSQPTATPPAAGAKAVPAAGKSKPQPAASMTPSGPTPTDAGAGIKPGKASDRIQLDTTQISGNRELPRVMYVVPWRRPDPGDFSGRPLNSLLDEALTPVDRDVLRRQNRYYEALQTDTGSGKSQAGTAGGVPAAPTPQDEK